MRKFLLVSICGTSLAVAGAVAAQPGQPVAPEPAVQPAPYAAPLRVAQPQTRTAVVDKVRAHFARLDTDRDGYLTKAEAQAGRRTIKAHRGQWAGRGTRGQRDPGAMFERLDTNRDGAISREEFDSGHQRRQAMRAERGGQPGKRMHAMRGGGMRLGGHMFERADLNRDSRVSLQEATDAAVRHFDTADINRDGTLAPEERQQMRNRMKEMHRVTRPS
jgi:hypothetical protein